MAGVANLSPGNWIADGGQSITSMDCEPCPFHFEMGMGDLWCMFDKTACEIR